MISQHRPFRIGYSGIEPSHFESSAREERQKLLRQFKIYIFSLNDEIYLKQLMYLHFAIKLLLRNFLAFLIIHFSLFFPRITIIDHSAVKILSNALQLLSNCYFFKLYFLSLLIF